MNESHQAVIPWISFHIELEYIFKHAGVFFLPPAINYPFLCNKWMQQNPNNSNRRIFTAVGADLWSTCWSDWLNASIQPAMAASPCFYCLTQWWIIYLPSGSGGQKIWFSCLQIHETSATEQLLLHVAKVTYQGIFSRFCAIGHASFPARKYDFPQVGKFEGTHKGLESYFLSVCMISTKYSD